MPKTPSREITPNNNLITTMFIRLTPQISTTASKNIKMKVHLGLVLLGLVPLYAISAHAQTMAPVAMPPSLTAPVITVPAGIGGGNNDYAPAGGITCPTPSIGLSGFGLGGDDNFNNYGTFGSASTSRDNYGITGGFNLPLSPGLSRACKEYFEAKAKYEKERAKLQIRESQLLLLRQCFWLEDNSFDLSHPGFKQEAFKELEPCLALKGFAIDRNRTAAKSGAGALPKDSLPQPSDAQNQPFSNESPVIIEERTRFRGGRSLGIGVGF